MPTIGKIKVNLEGDTRRFQRSMRGARRSVRRFDNAFRGLGRRLALVGGGLGFGLLLRRTADEALVLKQLSDRVGTNVEAFSKLTRVLGRSGIQLSEVGTIVQRMERRAGEAAEGNEKLSAAFAQLGIDVQAFVRLDPVEAFLQLGEALARIENPSKRLLAAFRILDTEGVKVLQADLANLRRDLAGTTGITDKQAESVTKLAARWDKLKESLRSTVLQLGEQSGIFGAVERGLGRVREFFSPESFQRGERNVERRRAATRALFNRMARLIPIIGPREDLGPPPVTAPLTGTIGGARELQGGNLERSNRLLEQIRDNTARPQPAVAQ